MLLITSLIEIRKGERGGKRERERVSERESNVNDNRIENESSSK